jgi:hypothetical protein
MWKIYLEIFHGILPTPQNIVMDMNDVMFTNAARVKSCCVKANHDGIEQVIQSPMTMYLYDA